MPTSRLEIDLGAIERNVATLREIAGPAALCAVVKQDAYGCGAPRVARKLIGLQADMLAVYSLDEARALAESSSGGGAAQPPILVLMPALGIDRFDPLYRAATSGKLHLVIHSSEQLAGVIEMAARLGACMPVHLQVDTGLARGGERPALAGVLLDRIAASQRLSLAGVFTHFASPADDPEFTEHQFELFRQFIQTVQSPAVPTRADPSRSQPHIHAANSVAAFRSARYHGSMLRVGQAIYGYALDQPWTPLSPAAGPSDRALPTAGAPGDDPFEFAAQARRLCHAVRWVSTIVHIQEIPPGWPVGYGSTWRAPHRVDGRHSRIALIPVGYGDGYPRALSREGAWRDDPRWGRAPIPQVAFTGEVYDRRAAEDVPAIAPARPPRARPPAFAPVVGRVSMDQITVDVTDVPVEYLRPAGCGAVLGSGGEIVGPEVELISRDKAAPNALPTLAAAAGSVAHELLCRIGPRVQRVYKHATFSHSGSVNRPGAEALTVAPGAYAQAEPPERARADSNRRPAV